MSNARRNEKAAIPTARPRVYTWLMRIKPKYARLTYSAGANQAAAKTRVTKHRANFWHVSNAPMLATAQRYAALMDLTVRTRTQLMKLENATASLNVGL